MEKERDEAKQEAKVVRLEASAVGDARARAEEDLARVHEALAAAEEGRRKAEDETARLEVERTSLLLDLGATKDEVSFLHSQAGRDKKAMEEGYRKVFGVNYICILSVLFVYFYNLNA